MAGVVLHLLLAPEAVTLGCDPVNQKSCSSWVLSTDTRTEQIPSDVCLYEVSMCVFPNKLLSATITCC